MVCDALDWHDCWDKNADSSTHPACQGFYAHDPAVAKNELTCFRLVFETKSIPPIDYVESLQVRWYLVAAGSRSSYSGSLYGRRIDGLIDEHCVNPTSRDGDSPACPLKRFSNHCTRKAVHELFVKNTDPA